MKELTEMAAQYAAEKTKKVLTNAIAEAYADGYRNGYNDREKEVAVELCSDSKTEFVDLGLPSGTLWAADYEKEEDDKIIYLPYQKAECMQLPTEELCEELFEACKWKLDYKNSIFSGLTCIGPSGNSIYFSAIGHKEGDSLYRGRIYFWTSDCDDDSEKNAVYMSGGNSTIWKDIRKMFWGYKLPIRLVRKK